jgi:L-seryl-tRNA(Ser) seleniumtransferase
MRKKAPDRHYDSPALPARPNQTAGERPGKEQEPHSMKGIRERLRRIPSVDELIGRPRLHTLALTAGQTIVTDAVRAVLADVRARLVEHRSTQDASSEPETQDELSIDRLEQRIAGQVWEALAPSLCRVINATGVILHTNLGRAPLASAVLSEIEETATRYSNLEYDIPSGERGKRDVHTSRLLALLTGAEAAIVVNNNAAAVFLILNSLAKSGEVIVSRGELIEIGDGFRIPDIMAESGAIVHEVGTTNRTRVRDYERAISERTRLLLRVHPSNFRMTGFTARPSLEELVALGERSEIPVYEDLGSGCLASLSDAGIGEPVIRASSDAGASVLSFSGDKLLGGPQAGIIVGKKRIIERIRQNSLFRALRVDKLTIAALEVTLKSCYRRAFDEIPALRMIRLSQDEIARRAKKLVEALGETGPDLSLELRDGFSVIGGGSTPDQRLPTSLIALRSARYSAAALDERLRKPQNGVPVVARIEQDRLVLDLRTVFPDEESILAEAIRAAGLSAA